MSTTLRRAVSLLLFVVIPAAAAIAPLLVIPAITSRFGAAGWGSVAVGLSVGVAASVVGELGWSIVGPQRIARDAGLRRETFDHALASRLVAVLLVAPVAVLTTSLVVEAHKSAALVLTLGVLAGSLSPSWFFTGLGRPLAILACETVPRVLFAVASAAIILLGGPLEAYGAGMILAALVTAILAARHPDVRLLPSRKALRAVPATMRAQAVLLLGRGLTTIYKSLPVVLVGIVSPGSVAAFAAVDRPLRMALTVLTAVPNRLQSWLGTSDARTAAKRSRVSLALNAGLGVVSGLAFALGMPFVAVHLFSGVVGVGTGLALLGGLLIAVICLSRGCGLSLVAAGRADDTTAAAAASAVVAVVAVPLGALSAGTEGAVIGLVLAEVAGILLQLPALHRFLGAGRPSLIAEMVR